MKLAVFGGRSPPVPGCLWRASGQHVSEVKAEEPWIFQLPRHIWKVPLLWAFWCVCLWLYTWTGNFFVASRYFQKALLKYRRTMQVFFCKEYILYLSCRFQLGPFEWGLVHILEQSWDVLSIYAFGILFWWPPCSAQIRCCRIDKGRRSMSCMRLGFVWEKLKRDPSSFASLAQRNRLFVSNTEERIIWACLWFWLMGCWKQIWPVS